MGRDRNREIIEEYPWLNVNDEQLTLLDMLPIGWHGLILDMCEELKHTLPKELLDKYQVIEAKEKWCMLRWYDGLCDLSPMPSTITNIVCKYEEQSKDIVGNNTLSFYEEMLYDEMDIIVETTGSLEVPKLNAKAAILYDATYDRILYEKNSNYVKILQCRIYPAVPALR